MSQDEVTATWSRVEDGFYVASRGGDFLGHLERTGDGRFVAFGGRGERVGEAGSLAPAMDLLLEAAATADDSAVPDGDLVSMVYTSFATSRFDDERLTDLLVHSRMANGEREVTGVLLYREGRFLQVLEGPADTVHGLVDAIRADGRHHDLRVIVDEPIHARRFGEWSMAFRPWRTPADRLPYGFRDAFDDLDDPSDAGAALRAVHELSVWFRYRADSASDDGD